MVKMAIAASTLLSSSGSVSATPCSAGAARSGRLAIISEEGSTAITSRSRGSYEPVPAPMLTTLRASPSAAQILASMRGSARRKSE
jgi:hypothetical protein